MTSAPADLLALRVKVCQLTGLAGVSVGVVGNGIHQRTGGFHEGMDVLTLIGRYHGPATAHVGSSVEDYSARTLRDRQGLTNSASAMDIGDDWPHGGRQAWLRFNNALYAELRDHPELLPALRAVNFSPDGVARKRYDMAHRGDGLIDSTDSVTIHTHLEFWRDTEGRRQPTLDRIATLIDAAISGNPTPQGDDMTTLDQARIENAESYSRAIATRQPVITPISNVSQDNLTVPNAFESAFAGLLADVATIKTSESASLAAIQTLAALVQQGGGNVDVGPVLAAIQAARDDTHALVTELQQENADLKTQVASLRAALSKAAQDAATDLAG